MKIMKSGKGVLLAAVLAGAAVSADVNAASVSYMLDQSNVLADGVNYLQVTIDDQGTPGSINFTVAPLSSAFTKGSNFGIQKFAFNGAALGAANIVFTGASSSGWSVSKNKTVSEFGKFSTILSGKGSHRADPLTFSITGISGDTIDTYAALSKGGISELFSAHVAGFKNGRVTSGYFGGGTLITPTVNPPASVPLPAAAWLFGSGLVGLVGIGSRRARKQVPSV